MLSPQDLKLTRASERGADRVVDLHCPIHLKRRSLFELKSRAMTFGLMSVVASALMSAAIGAVVGAPLSAYAQEASAPVSFEQARDQGVLYLNEQMFDLARDQFELAYKAPGGKGDFIVVYYRGFLAEKRLELEVAFQMADLAVSLSANDQEKTQAQELLDQLKGKFGYVEIKRNPNETNTKGRIYLEATRRILNRQKREQFQLIRERFRSNDIQVPTRIYLPYGKYTANGVPFQIKRNSEEIDSVEVILHIIQDDKPTEGGNGWLYTSLGVTGVAILGAGAYFLLKPEAQNLGNTGLGFKSSPKAQE